jgi:hypothetical protein
MMYWYEGHDIGAREERGMSAILAVTASVSSLRAVVRDPAVRLWAQLDYRGVPDGRCLIDGRPVPALQPPADAAEALRLVTRLVEARGIAVAAVAHHLADAGPEHAELIDDALLVKLEDRGALAVELTAIDAARAIWPRVPHIACFGIEPDIEAMMDRQARALLGASDDRVERMLTDPRGYFARARERARTEVERDIAFEAARARSR